MEKAVVTRLPPVGVNHIGHLLEGKEADTQGQHNVLQGDMGGKQAVHVGEKEVKILKIKQNSEIHQQSRRQLRPPGCLILRHPHQPGNAVIQHDGRKDNRQIAGVKVAVKPQGHSQKEGHCKGIPPEMVQRKVASQAQGQEQQNKNIGIKEHSFLTSL